MKTSLASPNLTFHYLFKIDNLMNICYLSIYPDPQLLGLQFCTECNRKPSKILFGRQLDTRLVLLVDQICFIDMYINEKKTITIILPEYPDNLVKLLFVDPNGLKLHNRLKIHRVNTFISLLTL